MPDFLTLKTAAEMLELIELFEPLGSEVLSAGDSYGRILAEPFLAPADLPGFDRSTVDGFAVRAKDVFGASEGLPAALTYLGECPMGGRPDITVKSGQTARISTGGMLPRGADAVVMLEYARLPPGDRPVPLNSLIELTRPLAPGDNVILADEDARRGQELIKAGQVLRAPELGLLAALGQETVPVRLKPAVAIMATGDEVVDIKTTPRPGQVRDINTQTIKALVTASGGTAVALGLVPDSLDSLIACVQKALSLARIVVITGGSSAGQRDFTLKALAAIEGSRILAHGVAVSPGKPLILAKLGQKSLWGLPGHPAGALVAAEIFLKPLIRRLTGQIQPVWPLGLKAVLSRPLASAQGRRDYFRVSLSRPEPSGPLVATPILGKSGLISTLVGAEALAVCPEEQEGLSAGSSVSIEILT
ncbi:MAG: molybdopterin molybdotransferase MoeA [Deltaproteobacteria bacterium]|jgi:molybdopterin molybdotransferase|nr:molybdopterin molybdotransferase MoeA [Deltaproteobacteria bacterium]